MGFFHRVSSIDVRIIFISWKPGFFKIIQYTKMDRYKPKDFVYYRIAEVIATCITLFIQYKRRPNIQERRDRWQTKIRLD
jgi:hypothetical protein